jgi:hypothetical protein
MESLFPATKELLVYVYQMKSIFITASCRSKMEAVNVRS